VISIFLAQWLLVVYLNLCAGSIAFVLAWQDETRRNSLLDFLVSWATLFLSVIVLFETALGILHLLTPAALAIGLGAGAVAAWLVFVKRGSVLALPPGWRDTWNRSRQALLQGRVPVSLVLVPWFAATFLVSALVEPSGIYDSFVYHLPMPIDWLQHAALTPTYIPMAEIANSYFPGNAELLYFWALAPFATICSCAWSRWVCGLCLGWDSTACAGRPDATCHR
jgi:hypothetical protein